MRRTRYHVLGLNHKGWNWLTDSFGHARKASAIAVWNKRKSAYAQGVLRKTVCIEVDKPLK